MKGEWALEPNGDGYYWLSTTPSGEMAVCEVTTRCGRVWVELQGRDSLKVEDFPYSLWMRIEKPEPPPEE